MQGTEADHRATIVADRLAGRGFETRVTTSGNVVVFLTGRTLGTLEVERAVWGNEELDDLIADITAATFVRQGTPRPIAGVLVTIERNQ